MQCQIYGCKNIATNQSTLLDGTIKLYICKECNEKYKPKKRSKYNNETDKTKLKCKSGHNHRSLFEKDHCNELRLLTLAGEILAFKYEPLYPLKVLDQFSGKIITYNHEPDFQIITKDMKTIIHETKGYKTIDVKLKQMLFCLLYPDIEYKIITKESLK